MNPYQHILCDKCLEAAEVSKSISQDSYDFWMDGTTQILEEKVTSKKFQKWLFQLADYYSQKDRVLSAYIMDLAKTKTGEEK